MLSSNVTHGVVAHKAVLVYVLLMRVDWQHFAIFFGVPVAIAAADAIYANGFSRHSLLLGATAALGTALALAKQWAKP